MNNIKMSKKEWLTVAIIPAELISGWLFSKTEIIKNPMISTVLGFLIFFTGFTLAILLNKDLLKSSWQSFKIHKWRNWGISVLFAILFGVVIQVSRMFIGSDPAASSASILSVSNLSIITSALVPLMAPFAEELVFRHILFFKWRYPIVRGILFALLSSFLFGLVHFNNYGGNIIMTVPLMLSGILFSGIYYFSKNIWFPISAHFIYNAALSFIPAIFVFIVQNFLA